MYLLVVVGLGTTI